MRVLLVVNVIPLLLTGCGDPTRDTPVALKPGLYEIAAGAESGDSYVEISPSRTRGEKCLSQFDASEFDRFPMIHATRRRADCTDKVEPRTGNVIFGTRHCAATFRGDDESDWTYEAVLSEEGFVIKGMVRDHRDGSGTETGPFNVTGRRVGDC